MSQQGPSRDPEISQLVVAQGLSGDQPGWWVQPECLVKNGPGQAQVWDILKSGLSALQHG